MKTLTAALALFCVVLIAAPAAHAREHKPKRTVDVQLLAINDFHGNLEPAGSLTMPDGTRVPAGGAEYLATHVKRLRARNRRGTAVVSAGDLIGASPLISAYFHDEPTIESMNRLGLDFNAVGNHELDEGPVELKRMQRGGCHPADGCQDGDGFAGAAFPFLAANTVRERSGRTLFPPYRIKRLSGVRVAFVGLTLEDTPAVVTPAGVAGLDFLDEADTLNRLVPRLRRRGVQTVVAMIHEGGFQAGSVNDCDGISGPIVDIVDRTSQEVDLFVTGHTHAAYNCVIDGRPVTSTNAFGRLLTDIDMRIDWRTKEPRRIRVNNRMVTQDVAKDPVQTRLLDKYRALVAPIANAVIGSVTADLTRAATPAGESALGDVIADAQLAATASSGGAQIAFMNPGGIRADLTAGEVTYNEAFTVQPFANTLVTMTLTGGRIEQVLEQQPGTSRTLQVSAGFEYSWNPDGPVGDKVDPASIRLDGVPLDPAAGYRVTVNNFLADGGDGFTVLREGTNRVGGGQDIDALVEYFGANSPLAPPPRDRIAVAP